MRKTSNLIIFILATCFLCLLIGITYSFFNYTRTGSPNNFSVGRIYFSSNQSETINLTNAFPISRDDINTDTNNVDNLVIEIEGDTDYDGGIEYLISSRDSEIYTSSGKLVPIGIDISVSNLGDNDPNYFINRDNTNVSIYKKLAGNTLVGDEMLLVGYIKPNSTNGVIEGIDGTITIKAFFDIDEIAITDTYNPQDPFNPVPKYILNPNMTPEVLSECVSYAKTNMHISNPDSEIEAFCHGDTITLGGSITMTFMEMQQSFLNNDNELATLIEKNIYIDENALTSTLPYTNETTSNWVDNRTILTTDEWNSLSTNGISFKIRVEANEGIWVNASLEEIMKMNNIGIDTSNGVDFNKTSLEDNSLGVYTRSGTENNAYPVLYYRGDVNDNNVIFANKCWKMVRTTDTGGVKLIYNGLPSNVVIDDNYGREIYQNVTMTKNPFTFNEETNEWQTRNNSDIKFNVSEAGDYILKTNLPVTIPITATRGETSLNILPGVTEIPLNNLTPDEDIYIEFNYSTAGQPFTVALNKGVVDLGVGCNNSGNDIVISLNIDNVETNTFPFRTVDGTRDLIYVGYMHGDTNEYGNGTVNNSYYDTSFTWDGSNYYLTDNATTTKSNSTPQYSCGVANTKKCTKLRYYYNGNNYIIVGGGNGIKETLSKSYANKYDSNAKNKVDLWYSNNMTSYTNKLEDTIYCNDRSMNNTNGWNIAGTLSENLLYGGAIRDWTSSNNNVTPSLVCPNMHDAFTVNPGRGNGDLTYPVGLITSDEIILAGEKRNINNGSSYIAKEGEYYWTMTPAFFDYDAYEYMVMGGGFMSSIVNSSNIGLRPVISLKPGQPVIKGTGTIADPYVIE